MTAVISTGPVPKKSIIAVTMGDAAGVGPELCLQLLARKNLQGALPLIIGDGDLLRRVAAKLKRRFSAPCLMDWPKTLACPAVLDLRALRAGTVRPGFNQKDCGAAAALYIHEAVSACLSGRCAAMMTAPISKKALNMAGVDFPGHTEMLAHLTGTRNYAMLLYSGQIACAFATCHQALRTVPTALTKKSVMDVAELAWRHVSALRKRPARLCVLGLNPHAGEEGLFGDEEQRILIPVCRSLSKKGIDVTGPLPPDTAFTPQSRKRFDCYIAMYHDQGSIPFKMLAFDTGVNITMGLPIIRTSPDHGTAFDIAWRGKAAPDSFFSAYDTAARLARKKVQQ